MKLEFNYDFVSPMSYFALVQLPEIQRETGCETEYVPVFLGGIMQATGNVPPPTIKAKRAYMMKDMARLAHKLDVPFAYNPYFPMNTLSLLRMVAGMTDKKEQQDFIQLVFKKVWVEQLNVADASVCEAFLSEAGYDMNRLTELAQDPANKEKIKENTESAIARGAFGAPTFFVGDDMYFGQDRLHLVKDALTGNVWA